MRCPGQDMRSWKEDAAFEVPCPKCGHEVEIFRDEVRGRCSKCDHRFDSPKMDLGCAEWCSYAKECLGFAPPKKGGGDFGEGAIAGKLIQAIQERFRDEPARITRALVIFQHAKELAKGEQGDARIVLAASLSLALLGHSSDNSAAEEKGTVDVPRILKHIGLDEGAIARVCEILDSRQSNETLDSVEFRILCDSEKLTDMGSRNFDSTTLDDVLKNGLQTETGQQRAQNLFGPPKS